MVVWRLTQGTMKDVGWPRVCTRTTFVPFGDPSAWSKVCPGIIPSRSKDLQRREELGAYCLMVLPCYFWVCSSLALPGLSTLGSIPQPLCPAPFREGEEEEEEEGCWGG